MPRPLRAAPWTSRRWPSDIASRRRSPGACLGWDRGSPRTCAAARRSSRASGRTRRERPPRGQCPRSTPPERWDFSCTRRHSRPPWCKRCPAPRTCARRPRSTPSRKQPVPSLPETAAAAGCQGRYASVGRASARPGPEALRRQQACAVSPWRHCARRSGRAPSEGLVRRIASGKRERAISFGV